MEKIVWTKSAIKDLKIIYDYVSNDSSKIAEIIISKIILRVDQLRKFPNSGRVVPELNNINIREIIEGNYRVIYEVRNSHVSILRIHHSSMKI